ncbi:MAG: hypothetical protein L3J59_16330 [Methylococcaceae bacterium]|nr:hypothetical protein [Methylococcaceae bacterium]
MIKIASKILLASILSTTTLYAQDVKFEMGLGVPYGILGGNASIETSESTELFAGMGLALGAVDTGMKTEVATGLGYSAGGRFYINESIRLTAGYGIVGGIVTGKRSGFGTISDVELETLPGAFAGIGYKSGSKSQGFSIDIMYLDSSKLEEKAKELGAKGYRLETNEDISNIKLALGYRF